MRRKKIRPGTGVFVFYATVRNEVERGEVLSLDKREVQFVGGGWCEVEECFLTERQCRRAKRLPALPPVKLRLAATTALALLEGAARKLRDALE